MVGCLLLDKKKILKRWVGAEEDDYLVFSIYNKKKLKKVGD